MPIRALLPGSGGGVFTVLGSSGSLAGLAAVMLGGLVPLRRPTRRAAVAGAQLKLVPARETDGGGADEERSDLRAAAFDAAADPMFTFDAAGAIMHANRAFALVSGCSAGELTGRTLAELASPWQSEDVLSELWETLGRGAAWRGSLRNARRDGSSYTLEVSVAAVPTADAPLFVAVCRDATASRRTVRELENLAYYDPLTGLANPRLMRDRARQLLALARRNGSTAVLLHVDLDDFASVNQQYGRSTGDEVLCAIAHRLRQGVRESDSLARVGSDEFLILLNEVADEQSVARAVRRLHTAIARPINIREQSVRVKPHFGVALYPQDGCSYDELLGCAEAAVRRAYERDSAFEFFEPGISAASHERLSLEDVVHRAWENEQFLLHYQPIMALDGTIVGAEALARGEVREPGGPAGVRRVINPSEFIPLAERTGRIIALDRWAIATAARQAAAWQAAGWHGWISVNLSARTLHDPELPAYVARTCAAHQLSPGHLVIEITESTAMRDPVLTARVLEELRASGALIAVDDFGVGHSSLAYLKLFPVDLLKLDACFVRELGTGSRDEQLVEIMIALAHRIGARVVAEGVEEGRQLAWLKRAGCDLIQGYLVGRPTAPASAPATLLSVS